MIVTPLAAHSPRAIRDTLLRHGLESWRADTTGLGASPVACHVAGLDEATLEALVGHGARLGLEVVTGPDWAIVAGSRARLSALARPWGGPPELAELAHAVGLALPADPPVVWPTSRGPVALDRPVLVGILNVTPDSFSDGGRFLALPAALAHAERLLADGAHILDIGGESTRPGAEPVPPDEQQRRVVPVVEQLARAHPAVPISVDTVDATVAAAALEAGAAIVNDVSAFRLDPAMAPLVARTGAGAILMHSRGDVREMAGYAQADYADGVVAGVLGELRLALERASVAGVVPDRVVIDPGFGFAKTEEQNILLLDQLAAFQALGRPILVGPSRKRFLGSLTGRPADDRDRATAAACALAYERGARLFRVHDVAAVRDALALAHAVGGG